MIGRWRRFSTRLLAICLVLITLVSLSIPAFASKYNVSPNWGIRDQVCTELSDDAEAYYTGSYTYDNLSTLSSSSLKTTLHKLMGPTSAGGTHKKMTSYDDCRDNSPITDCEGGDSSHFTMIYTSYSATYSQYNGGQGWNREHVWPKSLGGFDTSSAGSDLHHIRPSESVVNSFRNNQLYGNVSGGSTKAGNLSGIIGGSRAGSYFEPLDNVKGDVARIILYVHVRYYDEFTKTNTITNVFQSIDVLLEWCALDPVDTWEMGRNDVVQDIQGNRNVFIDYPELAWKLFGKSVPANMTTPSGGVSTDGGNGGNGDNTGGDNTGDDTPVTPTITPIATIHKSSAGNYTAEGVVVAKNARSYLLKDDTGAILVYLGSAPSVNVGDQLRVTGTTSTYGGAIQFGNGTTHTKLGTTTVTHPTPILLSGADCDNYLSNVTLDYVKVIGTLSASQNYYNLAIDGATGITGSVTYPADTSVLTPLLDKEVELTGYVTGVTGSTAKYLNFMMTGIKAYTAPSEPCTHNNTSLVGQIKATCEKEGYTGDTYCNDCGAKIGTGRVIPAIGTHTWGAWQANANDASIETRTCSACNATETRTVIVDCKHPSTEIRNATDATCKAGYTGDTYCTNCGEKLATGTAIAPTGTHIWGGWQLDEANPANEKNTCTVCGESKTQMRLCDHAKTEIRGAVAATCKAAGYTGDTYCQFCSALLSLGSATAVATDNHTFSEWNPPVGDRNQETRTCSLCGETEVRDYQPPVVTECEHAHTEILGAKNATCKEAGYTGDTYCADCCEKLSAGEAIPVAEHTFGEATEENGATVQTCTVCGYKKSEVTADVKASFGCTSVVSSSLSLVALITLAGAAMLAKKRED